MYYLDTNNPVELFKRVLKNKIYVDKSMLINKLNDFIGSEDCYFCITRPRRFGKTINANMLGAYYTQGYDTHDLFKDLKIVQTASYEEHINKHHVIYIDFSNVPQNCNSYEQYIDSIYKKMRKDLIDYFHIEVHETDDSLSDFFLASQEKFIFIIDEWDSIFYEDFMQEKDKFEYLKFLKRLLKSKTYVELVYMTGVLPIAKYSTGSELNMFKEYNFMNDSTYEDYFGFDEKEVKELTQHFSKPSYEVLKEWYDGYYKSDDTSLFNPRSVSFALRDGVCKNYWTETGPMNEIAEYIEHNVGAVREDIVKMVAGIPIRVKLKGYSASDLRLNSRDEILSAMVVFGFLSYHNGYLRIPNFELMEKFEATLERKSMGGVAEVVENSEKILEETINGNAEKVAEMIELAHDKEIPFIQYNDENSMSCLITLCYLKARDDYEVTREDKSGKGYVDFLFKPKNYGDPAIILELKYDKNAQEAINQIKEKNYIEKVKNVRECLLVGINYDKKNKKHTCIIEKMIQEVYE